MLNDVLNLFIQALQEFAEFLSTYNKTNSNIEVSKQHKKVLEAEAHSEGIKAVLPFWPRLYCKLSNDNDRRVREAAHKAHLQRK